MKTHDFFYDLPRNLIAQTPTEDRSASRLMVLDKHTGKFEHKHFSDIIDYLSPHDCLVINDTRVIPARLIGQRRTGGHAELLLLTRKDEKTWEALAKPGRKIRIGDEINFGTRQLTAKVIDILEDGKRLISFSYEGIFEEVLDLLGETPLPPYITQKLSDKTRYQTVYAVKDGSAAAPTAGLHFTQELLRQLEQKGVKIAKLTLHIGLGTFRPVKTDDILKHKMHSEYYEISPRVSDIINDTRNRGGRIIAVGTTSCRALESARDGKKVHPSSGWTDIFIYPGYKFKVIDGLITNFHLPESTLLMLVSALAGRERILTAYQAAVNEKYRFFSFGDAMFILP
ncbi:MAG: tRNA preQ1(34) S-adenosylmethionine ribosyltransferase-isomerase QueA [Clostridiales bacterium]|jgi:S-adenosylmethionine:tRNA ribosyltransferase-isomerase|nr:tRNA preQ1(34) S-adenosylmethionine ribosyltransferase-isomerase QueA [Clostridiales bacterium]